MVVLGLVLLWVYALSGAARRDAPDLLDDPSFATAAEPVCAEARDALAELPPAQQAPSPEARATTLADANAVLATMVDDLAALAPEGDDRDARITALWLADWRTHLADRDRYVAALESGSTEPAQFTARGGRSITTTIDHFAEVNSMPSCATPLDV
ncbi:MAG: hypothetical protein KDB35_15940 [Acidimicrobiales bacterium]|nr:hypothetical protein [Acidimicrobiales bacterium]MCB9371348.1 hypothetical protein [Microthrixaceae bacterium]